MRSIGRWATARYRRTEAEGRGPRRRRAPTRRTRQTVTMPDDDGLEREIDALYAADPDGFTAARDSLAKRLKADGDDDAAKRVKALHKPVRSAWAVNRLV